MLCVGKLRDGSTVPAHGDLFDGSLTLDVQSEKPDASTATTWPTPKECGLKLALKLYSPKPEGAQATPPIERAG